MLVAKPIRDLHHMQTGHEMNNAYVDLGSALTSLLERHDNPTSDRIGSGFPRLDEYMGGFVPGELIVLASRPSMGRNPVLIRMIDEVALEHRQTVLVASTDYDVDRFCQYGIGSQFPWFGLRDRIRRSDLEDKHRKYLSYLVEKYKASPIVVVDRAGLSVKQISAQAEAIRINVGPLGLIVVTNGDALNLQKFGTSRYDQLLGLSKALKKLAQRHGCTVLVESEVSRRLEKRKRKNMRPLPSDLCCRGALAKYADKLLFVYNDQIYFPSASPCREIIIGKNRNGPVGFMDINEDQIYKRLDRRQNLQE